MKVSIAFPGKFHAGGLARELHLQGTLEKLITGYPRRYFQPYGIPESSIQRVRLPHSAFMLGHRIPWIPRDLMSSLEYYNRRGFDLRTLPYAGRSEVFVALSGCATRSLDKAKRCGSVAVCDRASVHIAVQDAILAQEHERWGMPYQPIDPRVIELELQDYETADLIVTPSRFARDSFISEGFNQDKVKAIPLGVDTSIFSPGDFDQKREKFTVLFAGNMSLQKGIPYLVEAFTRLPSKNRQLVIAGKPSPTLELMLRKRGLWNSDISVLGPLSTPSLSKLMTECHVLVLPSVQDGFGLVALEAMASGLPVIASTHTGIPDVSNGQGALIFENGDVEHLHSCLEQLYNSRELQRSMALEAVALVARLQGWGNYGQQVISLYRKANERIHNKRVST